MLVGLQLKILGDVFDEKYLQRHGVNVIAGSALNTYTDIFARNHKYTVVPVGTFSTVTE